MKLGRDVVYDYLKDLGVRYLFGVPGTNEIPLIDGTNVESYGVSYIPCLHENIAVGAAMGYARMTGRPGVVQLHVTPGAAHGVGNLFNAYKSHIPLVILCAQQHNELLVQEPLLASDLVQVARQYTKWAYEVRFPDELPIVLQRAFKEALTPPMRPVFVSIPWEFTLAQVLDGPPRVTRVGQHFTGDREAIRQAADRLALAANPVIVTGDGTGAADVWDQLTRLAELIGAPVYNEALSSYMNFPNRDYHWQGELPTTQAGMREALGQDAWKGRRDVAFFCGFNSQAPVLVYKYSDGPLIPAHHAPVYQHNDQWELGKNGYGEAAVLGDIAATLPLLIEAVAANPDRDEAAARARNDKLRELASQRDTALRGYAETSAAQPGNAPITGHDLAVALASLQPEMRRPLLLANEAISDSPAFQAFPHYEDPASYFCSEGGSLGYSMPASIGLKLAVGSSRTVVNVVGDGSALFYPHTWWTTRKFNLPVLYVITNNREYKTLQAGLQQVDKVFKWQPSGPAWYLELHEPPVSFSGLAAQFEISGACVSRHDELLDRLRAGLKHVEEQNSPYVLDVHTDPALSAPMPRLDAFPNSKESTDEPAQFRHLNPA